MIVPWRLRHWWIRHHRYQWQYTLDHKLYRLGAWRSYQFRVLGVRLWRKPGVEYWNWDKPHRCPVCHTIVDTGHDPTNWETAWALYQCCQCGNRYARWPRLARRLRVCQDIATGRCPHQRKDRPS